MQTPGYALCCWIMLGGGCSKCWPTKGTEAQAQFKLCIAGVSWRPVDKSFKCWPEFKLGLDTTLGSQTLAHTPDCPPIHLWRPVGKKYFLHYNQASMLLQEFKRWPTLQIVLLYLHLRSSAGPHSRSSSYALMKACYVKINFPLRIRPPYNTRKSNAGPHSTSSSYILMEACCSCSSGLHNTRAMHTLTWASATAIFLGQLFVPSPGSHSSVYPGVSISRGKNNARRTLGACLLPFSSQGTVKQKITTWE